MLNTKVDTLFEVTIAYDFVDDDTDGTFCHIVDDARSTVVGHKDETRHLSKWNLDSPVVVLVRHTLLLGGIGFNINDVAYTVGDKERRQFNGAMF
jgi:hypothetical protein